VDKLDDLPDREAPPRDGRQDETLLRGDRPGHREKSAVIRTGRWQGGVRAEAARFAGVFAHRDEKTADRSGDSQRVFETSIRAAVEVEQDAARIDSEDRGVVLAQLGRRALDEEGAVEAGRGEGVAGEVDRDVGGPHRGTGAVRQPERGGPDEVSRWIDPEHEGMLGIECRETGKRVGTEIWIGVLCCESDPGVAVGWDREAACGVRAEATHRAFPVDGPGRFRELVEDHDVVCKAGKGGTLGEDVEVRDIRIGEQGDIGEADDIGLCRSVPLGRSGAVVLARQHPGAGQVDVRIGAWPERDALGFQAEGFKGPFPDTAVGIAPGNESARQSRGGEGRDGR
jgi:hypothetical protein